MSKFDTGDKGLCFLFLTFLRVKMLSETKSNKLARIFKMNFSLIVSKITSKEVGVKKYNLSAILKPVGAPEAFCNASGLGEQRRQKRVLL